MSIASNNDALKILTQTLQADVGIQEAVKGRVFGGHLKDSDVESTLKNGAILIVALKGGSSIYSGAVQTIAFDVWGYSLKSASDASKAYDAAYKALQASRVTCTGVDLCGLSREVQRPAHGHNAKHSAWFSRGRWVLSAA